MSLERLQELARDAAVAKARADECRAERAADIERFEQMKREWLDRFAKSNGVHNPILEAEERAFHAFKNAIMETIAGEVR